MLNILQKYLIIHGNKYVLNQPVNFKYVVAGNIFKRLYLLTNVDYNIYHINNNIHLSQFENTQTFYDLIDDNNAIYVIDETHEEYKLSHIYEFKLMYSDISAETLNINGFNKIKDILEKTNMYDIWLNSVIED
jgi:hypothetical protein